MWFGIDRRLLKNFDYILFASFIALIGIGMLVIYSATHSGNVGVEVNFVFKQFVWFIVGLFLFLFSACISYRMVEKHAYLIYVVTLGLLIAVLLFADPILGAQRWLRVGDFSFQPSELAKLTMILVLVHFCSSRKDEERGWKFLILTSILVIVPVMLILKQPDLGTAVSFIPLLLVAWFISGVPIKKLFLICLVMILLAPLLWFVLRDYQRQRILIFLNPNMDPLGAGYSAIQSKIAIGSGGLFGKGFLQGTQTQLNFLPEHHTDFIFSVLGEEFGFLGVFVVIGLYFIIITRSIRIALLARDYTGSLMASLIVTMLLFHVIVNISMTIGLMPVTGLPLPFISCGGSSLILNMVLMGLLLNIGMRRFMF